MSSCIDLTFGQEKRQPCVCLMVGNTAVSLHSTVIMNH